MEYEWFSMFNAPKDGSLIYGKESTFPYRTFKIYWINIPNISGGSWVVVDKQPLLPFWPSEWRHT